MAALMTDQKLAILTTANGMAIETFRDMEELVTSAIGKYLFECPPDRVAGRVEYIKRIADTYGEEAAAP